MSRNGPLSASARSTQGPNKKASGGKVESMEVMPRACSDAGALASGRLPRPIPSHAPRGPQWRRPGMTRGTCPGENEAAQIETRCMPMTLTTIACDEPHPLLGGAEGGVVDQLRVVHDVFGHRAPSLNRRRDGAQVSCR